VGTLAAKFGLSKNPSGFFGNQEESKMLSTADIAAARNPSLLQWIFLAQISRLGPSETVAFWGRALGLSGAGLERTMDLLCDGEMPCSREDLPRLLGLVRADLAERGIRAHDFIRDEVFGQFGPCILEPEDALAFLDGGMTDPFQAVGLLLGRFRTALTGVLERMFAGLGPIKVQYWPCAGGSGYTVEIALSGGSDGSEYAAWIGPLVEKVPLIFGYGPGESFLVAVDPRDPEPGDARTGEPLVWELRMPLSGMAVNPMRLIIAAAKGYDTLKFFGNRRLWKERLALPGSPPGYEIIFLRQREILLLNGSKLTSKVPARILRYFLENHLGTGRKRFNVSELTTHSGIIEDFRQDPSINVRLIRLQRTLLEKAPLMVMTRNKGTGLIDFHAGCETRFSELDA
jgi:hypothetical protein